MDEQKVRNGLRNFANIGGAVVAALAAFAEVPSFDPVHVSVFAAGLIISIFGGHRSGR